MVMVFGEITTSAKVDYEKVVRDTCREIGFVSDDVGLDADKCKVSRLLFMMSEDATICRLSPLSISDASALGICWRSSSAKDSSAQHVKQLCGCIIGRILSLR